MSAARILAPRTLGSSRSDGGRFTRVVDRVLIHGAPIDFRELCARVLPPTTRYLVLDLDRTIHLGRNMGELLGWEICAFLGYGPERFAELLHVRRPGRFLWDHHRPISLLRYLGIGARMWAYPGLFYFLYAKVAQRSDAGRRLTYRVFGPEPIGAIQRIPQLALMHHMSELPLDLLRELSRGLFDRYAGEQVVDRTDILWLRDRCPGIRILISSASPQPVVEAARDWLGVDEAVHSNIAEHEGMLAAPWLVDWRFLQPAPPRRIAEPSALRINGGHNKIAELERRHPEIFRGECVTVGMTDNGSGEDQSWAQYFTKVVEVNGTAPFAPILAHDSPLREIHRASVLTQAERDARASGGAAYLSPRRHHAPTGEPRGLEGVPLAERLAPTVARVETLAGDVARMTDAAADDLAACDVDAAQVRDRITDLARRYNETTGAARRAPLRDLRREVAAGMRVERLRRQIIRPISTTLFEITRTIEAACREVDSAATALLPRVEPTGDARVRDVAISGAP